jgi:hypothetical protein
MIPADSLSWRRTILRLVRRDDHGPNASAGAQGDFSPTEKSSGHSEINHTSCTTDNRNHKPVGGSSARSYGCCRRLLPSRYQHVVTKMKTLSPTSATTTI